MFWWRIQDGLRREGGFKKTGKEEGG